MALFPDLYVCNDLLYAGPNLANDGHGVPLPGRENLSFRETRASAMGVDFCDLKPFREYGHLCGGLLRRSRQLRKRHFRATTHAPPVGAIAIAAVMRKHAVCRIAVMAHSPNRITPGFRPRMVVVADCWTLMLDG